VVGEFDLRPFPVERKEADAADRPSALSLVDGPEAPAVAAPGTQSLEPVTRLGDAVLTPPGMNCIASASPQSS